VSTLHMHAHDPAPRGYAVVEHVLHYLTLADFGRQPDTVALPVRARPFGFVRCVNARHAVQRIVIRLRATPAAGDDLRQPLELLASYGGLNVRHPVVVARLEIVFEDDRRATVANSVGNRHAMLAQQAETRVPLRI